MKGTGAFVALASLLALAAGTASLAQTADDARVTEDSVKAAYLYKFASYVDWPDSPGEDREESFRIGVLGAQNLADELETITTGRVVDGRSVVVRQLRSSDSIDDLHILFVGRDEAGRLDRLLAPARMRPILTVTDSGDALTAGSIINFLVQDERVRFEISLFEAEQSGLRLDSRLLAVARTVRRVPE